MPAIRASLTSLGRLHQTLYTSGSILGSYVTMRGVVLMAVLLAWALGTVAAEPAELAWKKYTGNPVIGGQYGTCFDIAVLKEAPGYRMWVSWRPQRSIALVESVNGTNWSGPPRIVLGPRTE